MNKYCAVTYFCCTIINTFALNVWRKHGIFFEIFMIGVGLSMDAFAASVCKGLSMRKAEVKNILIIALFLEDFRR